MLIDTREVDGFTIETYAHHENESPRGQFMNEDGSDDEETIAKIHNGEYAWFAAQVCASKAGITLGSDWIGCCCYESEAAFITPDDGYWPDMVNAAITEARAKLSELCAQ